MTTVAVSARLPRAEHEFAVAEAQRHGVSLTGYLTQLVQAERKQQKRRALWRPKSLALAGALEVGGPATNAAARAALARRRENR